MLVLDCSVYWYYQNIIILIYRTSMNISLDKLKYFLEVSKTEHVGMAGRILGISPSAISAAIASLEEECQCPLFERSNKRVFLNEQGRLLRERIEVILKQIEALPSEVNSKQALFRGYLSVGGSHFLANHFLQPTINDAQKKNLDLRTENAPLRTSEVIRDVLAGLLDYGLCFSPHEHPLLETVKLHTGTLVIAVSKIHPLVRVASKKGFHLKAINQYSAVIHKSSPGIDYCENHPEFARLGIEPQIAQYFHSDDLSVQSVINGNFWTMIPDVVAKYYQSKLYTLPLPDNWKAKYDIRAIYKKTMKQRPIFAYLDNALRDSIAGIF